MLFRSDIALAYSEVSSQEALSVTSTAGELNATSATLSSKGALALTAKNVIKAEGVAITGGDVVSIASTSGAVTLDRSEIISSQAISLEAKENLSLTSAEVSSKDNLTLKSYEGDVSAQGLTLTSEGEARITAKKDINLKNAKINERDLSGVVLLEGGESVLLDNSEVYGSTITLQSLAGLVSATNGVFDSTTGITLSGASGITATNATLNAVETISATSQNAFVNLSGATLKSGADLAVTAKSDANLSAATIDVESGAVTVRTSEGDIDLSATAATPALVTKSLTLSAGKNVDLTGRSAKTTDATATLSVAALGGVTLKDSTLNSVSAISIGTKGGSVEANNATLASAGVMSLTSTEGAVKLTGTMLKASPEVTVTSGDGITFRNSTTADGLTLISFVTGTNDIDVSGNSTLKADTVKFQANESDILLSDAAAISGTTAVNLFAGGSIIQIDKSSIATPMLTAQSLQSLYLSSEVGNDTPVANLTSLGDIAIATRVDTTVTVNEGFEGIIFGDLWLDAYGSSLVLTNEDVTAIGQVSLRARSITANDVSSFDDVFASTAFNGDTTADTLKIGNVIGSEIGLMTDKGQLEAGKLTAFGDSICIYRTSLTDAGSIRIVAGSAEGKALVYNGNGLISTPLVADKYVRFSLGTAGRINRSSFVRGVKTLTSHNLSVLTDEINEEYLDRKNDYKWFPMFDLGLSSYVSIDTAQAELRKVYARETKLLAKKPWGEGKLVQDHWTESIEGKGVAPRVFSF